MITGIHAIVYSKEAEKLRSFFKDVLEWPHIDSGGGWLIFALPPAEIAAHPSDGEPFHELYLMCDDINLTLEKLQSKGVEIVQEVSDQGWGLLATIKIPSGDEFGIYQPKHPVAINMI
jgi:predicted enzyme related to lactoylglutathione lyase